MRPFKHNACAYILFDQRIHLHIVVERVTSGMQSLNGNAVAARKGFIVQDLIAVRLKASIHGQIVGHLSVNDAERPGRLRCAPMESRLHELMNGGDFLVKSGWESPLNICESIIGHD